MICKRSRSDNQVGGGTVNHGEELCTSAIDNDLINKTVNYPDVVEPHPFDSKKIIKKKTFSFNVGCHGLSGFFCKTVLVVVKKMIIQ